MRAGTIVAPGSLFCALRQVARRLARPIAIWQPRPGSSHHGDFSSGSLATVLGAALMPPMPPRVPALCGSCDRALSGSWRCDLIPDPSQLARLLPKPSRVVCACSANVSASRPPRARQFDRGLLGLSAAGMRNQLTFSHELH